MAQQVHCHQVVLMVRELRLLLQVLLVPDLPCFQHCLPVLLVQWDPADLAHLLLLAPRWVLNLLLVLAVPDYQHFREVRKILEDQLAQEVLVGLMVPVLPEDHQFLVYQEVLQVLMVQVDHLVQVTQRALVVQSVPCSLQVLADPVLLAEILVVLCHPEHLQVQMVQAVRVVPGVLLVQ